MNGLITPIGPISRVITNSIYLLYPYIIRPFKRVIYNSIYNLESWGPHVTLYLPPPPALETFRTSMYPKHQITEDIGALNLREAIPNGRNQILTAARFLGGHHILMGMIHLWNLTYIDTKNWHLKKGSYIPFSKVHRLLGIQAVVTFSWGVMGWWSIFASLNTPSIMKS